MPGPAQHPAGSEGVDSVSWKSAAAGRVDDRAADLAPEGRATDLCCAA